MSSTSTLGRRSLSAALWAGGGHLLSQVLRLAGNLILTRMLMPEAFGIMSVIAALMAALYLLSDLGTGVSVVQSPRGTDPDFVNTAWTLQVIRGFSLWLIAIVCALVIAQGQAQQWFAPGSVYADPRLPGLWIAASFATVISGFASINLPLAERRLDLKRVFVLDLIGQLTSLTVMVVGSYLTGSVWALVVGAVTLPAVRCVLGHLLLKGNRMRFRWERAAVDELIGKGKWVVVSSALGFLAVNGDRFFLGGIIDSTTMGHYSIALGLAGISSAVINVLYYKVVFPSLSVVVRKHPEDLGKVYSKFQLLADLAIGTIAGACFMLSPQIVDLLYDDRYQTAGYIFGILCIGTIGERFRVVETIYMAMGKTSLVAWAMAPRVVVLVGGIFLGHAYWGLDGILWAVALSQFAHWPLAIWFRATQGLNNWSKDLALPLSIGAGLGLGWAVKLLVD